MELHSRRAGFSRVQAAALAAIAIAAGSGGTALAQSPAAPGAAGASAIPDPWEHANRGFYKFSMTVDKAVIAPVVHTYLAVFPAPVRKGVKNVVANLGEPDTFANDVLQAHPTNAGRTAARFVINSTIGIGGLFDVAGQTGLPGHSSDFGQTLGRWGAGAGNYIFVPFYGPSDVRDGFGKIVDTFGDPTAWVLGGIKTTGGQVYSGVHIFQMRVDIEPTLQGLGDFTDPYATLRSGYSQFRAAKVAESQGVTQATSVEALPDFGAEPAPAQ